MQNIFVSTNFLLDTSPNGHPRFALNVNKFINVVSVLESMVSLSHFHSLFFIHIYVTRHEQNSFSFPGVKKTLR